jgi:choline dehydrogenase
MEGADNQTAKGNREGERMATQDGASAGDTFDYVIVGSGAAGSVLANRLTEDTGATVCVLEAGPPDRHPYIHVPAGFIKMLFNPDFTWQFKTEPSEGSGGRPIPTTQGRTLGPVRSTA